MGKVEKIIEYHKQHPEEWCCGTCATGEFRCNLSYGNLRRKGYVFEEVSKQRYSKLIYCKICNSMTFHYKLLSSPTSLK